MKERLSLLEVCKLPEVQLHSKQALFKALVSKESEEAMNVKDHIIKLSYTVKTIGIQGGEVGISSKRVPLKLKKKLEEPVHNFIPSKEYLPHKSFYAEALIPVKRQKEKPKANDVSGLQIFSTISPIRIDSDSGFGSQQFKIRTKSMTQLRAVSKSLSRKQDENLEEFGRVQGRRSMDVILKKKSFSNMLKECTGNREDESINPLMHEQNPMFKKIKKIKQLYPDLCQEELSLGQFRGPNTKYSSSSSSNLLKQYREQL